MKQPVLILLFFVLVYSAPAQVSSCPVIPVQYHWETRDDYARDRELVEKVLHWLCRSPLGAYIEQRSVANAYVMEWLAGSPEVLIDVNTQLIPYLDKNPELLYTVIHGMALYQLNHQGEIDPLKAKARGLDVLAELCEQSVELSHEHALRPLLKAHRKGKMKEYINEKLQEQQ